MAENDKRLIEDLLPITRINFNAAKEKKHPKHPVTLVHYWPARRPTTACRAAIYSALVPAPKNQSERSEKNNFLEKLSAFNLTSDIVQQAAKHIQEAHGGKSPKILDMFAGGGAIPLEAARLGCEAYAVEYNPVAHIIELCTLVYPQRFGSSLSEDVKRWGTIVGGQVERSVRDLFPEVDGSFLRTARSTNNKQIAFFGGTTKPTSAQPAVYIWVRSVPCRKPGCPAQVPLVREAWLRKVGGFVVATPSPEDEGRKITWQIASGKTLNEIGIASKEQTGAGESLCLVCTTPVTTAYVKDCGKSGLISNLLASIVVDSGPSKIYLPPETISPVLSMEDLKERLEQIVREAEIDIPDEELRGKLRDQLPSYGFKRFRDVFTLRQLVVLVSFCKQIRQAYDEMVGEGVAKERALAITTYLAMAYGRVLNSYNMFCRWAGKDQCTLPAIGDRQALKMVYDFPEINPFVKTAGCWEFALNNEAYSIQYLSKVSKPCVVQRASADHLPYESAFFDAVITDPPYYGSIFYADLSSFFFVWLRRMIGQLYPEHFALAYPPKRSEAVAQPSEHDGNGTKADFHYREIMQRAFHEASRVLKPGAPMVCVYAHKTTQGWAALIDALAPAGFLVSEAWPVQTEARGRANSIGAAALSDSIFVVARRRETNTTGQYENGVRAELDQIVKEKVESLWDQGISGADLVIACVGAGLRAFTRYARVEYANGEEVPAKRFLSEVETVVLEQILNRLSREAGTVGQTSLEGVDSATRFYVLWRYTYRGAELDAGEAIIFANGTHVELDGPSGLSTGSGALVKKSKGKYRVLDYSERGDDETLGLPDDDGRTGAVIDVLHRTLWLMENRPAILAEFLGDAQPNREQMRLVAQALAGPALKGGELADVSPSDEMAALAKLTANWRSVIEDQMLPLLNR